MEGDQSGSLTRNCGRLAGSIDNEAKETQPLTTPPFSRRWRVAQNGTAKMEARENEPVGSRDIY